MNENCGLYQLQTKKKRSNGEAYLTRSFQLFYEYGAMKKIQLMRVSHPFLKAKEEDCSMFSRPVTDRDHTNNTLPTLSSLTSLLEFSSSDGYSNDTDLVVDIVVKDDDNIDNGGDDRIDKVITIY